MGNYLVVLLMSVFVLICAFYVNTVEQRLVQIKDDLLNHEKEIKEMKEELESTNMAHTQVKVKLESTRKELTQAQVELESTKKEVKQVKVELESTGKELIEVKVELELTRNEVAQVKVELESTRKELKQVKVELDTTREQINILRKEMIEKDNTCRKERNQIRVDVGAVREDLNKLKKELHTQRPGFYVTLSSHTTLSQTQRIEFDQIITDVTNDYNITGVFIVPKNGLYHFSLTMLSTEDKLHAQIMQNHREVGRNYGYSIGVSGTIDVVISCMEGDLVFVRHMPRQGAEKIHGGGYSAFSGFLIN